MFGDEVESLPGLGKPRHRQSCRDCSQFTFLGRTMAHFIPIVPSQGLPTNAFVGIDAARTASLGKIHQIDHDLIAT